MTFKEKEQILTKPYYELKDVKALLDCKNTKGHEVMTKCRKMFGGSIKGNDRAITPESFWKSQGTTLIDELRKVSIAIYGIRDIDIQQPKRMA